MSFISLSFVIFFILFVSIYHLFGLIIKNEEVVVIVQNFFLFMASIIFYSFADLRFLPFLLYIILVTYLGGRFSKNKIVIAVLIVASLIPLLFCKYNISHIIFPLGISFFTFQGIGYIIDCYKNQINISLEREEDNLLDIACFISFFPVISSGPIQRANKFIPQLNVKHKFNYDEVTDGMRLFAWGVFKKLCIADRIALYVNYVYGNLSDKYGVAVLLATVLYSFQIYCDFSGYTDMALGISKYFGFDVGKNFDHPYFSKTVGEFWRRWHISLSSWLRDYVYFPLGGSRVVLPRIYMNLIITFLISGIWHGAGWTFIIWGLLHGFYLCMGRTTRILWEKLHVPSCLRVCITFSLVTFAWIFFRSDSLSQAWLVIKKIVSVSQSINQFNLIKIDQGTKEAIKILFALNDEKFGNITGFLMLIIVMLIFLICEVFTSKKDGIHFIKMQTTLLRWFLYLALFTICLLTFVSGLSSNFIYKNF